MSKNSLINKKALVVMFVIILLIGAGVGAYFLFKPKPDLNAPYQNTYSLLTNTTYQKINNSNSKVVEYLNECLTSAQTSEEISQITLTLNKYTSLDEIYEVYDEISEIFLNNLPFVKDYDSKMVEVQQSMTKSFESVLEKLDACNDHYEQYLTINTVSNINNVQLFNYITNYNAIYFDYFTELASFFEYASNIFQSYTVKSFEVNPYSEMFIKTICSWAKMLSSNIISLDSDGDFAQLKLSLENLEDFVDTNCEDFEKYYLNKTALDTLLNNFNGLDFNTLITNLANNTYSAFIDEQTDESIISKLTVLGRDFFLVV